MALPALTMPATVPDWRADPHDFTLGQPFASVPVVVGAPRLRRISVGAAHVVRAEMLCSADEAIALDDWIESDLEAGTLPFAAKLLAPDGTREWWHARLLDMPRWAAVPRAGRPAWQVQATLRLQGDPETEAPA